MKIAIDARWIFPRISGIGAYTRELIRALAALDSKNRYTLLFDRADLRDRTGREAGLADHPNFESRVLPYGVFSARSQWALPGFLRSEKIDLFHSPNYMIPLAAFPRHRPGRARAVVTIHDVIPLLFPDHAPRSRKSRFFFLYKWLMTEVARRADGIITVSETSRRDCLKLLSVAPERADRVAAIPNGVSSRFQPAGGKPAPRKDPADTATPRSCLYVGRADPYKNLNGLVRAFALARSRLPFPLRLVIAGPLDERYPEAPSLARELGVTDQIAWTGYLSDAELVRLYQEADLLALPSRYEGFGLPVVEAMACGTPVLISTASALREVAGDAALMADPDDIGAMAGRLQEILMQPALAEKLVEKGVARAATFTWARTAAETLALYGKIAP
ncbi:MAG: glycosyltransferase family 1 protein [Kiritimatiellia bacterium]